MLEKEKIESILEKQGFSDYKWIDPKEIIVAQWVRVKCTFGCSDYGLGTCPPNSPSVSDCDKFFKEYESGLIVRLNKFADKNSYPSDWSKEMTEKLFDTEREVFMLGYQKTFLLNQAGCYLCSNCSKNRLSCKNKVKSRPSPESFAVDVYQTAKKVGFDISVISNSSSEINRIAILLVE